MLECINSWVCRANSFDPRITEGIEPTAITYIFGLKASGSIGSLEKSKQIHECISKSNILQKHTTLGNALVDMYAKCGALAMSQALFDDLPVHDTPNNTKMGKPSIFFIRCKKKAFLTILSRSHPS